MDEIDVDLPPAVIGAVPPLVPGEWPVRLRLRSAQVCGEGQVGPRCEAVREA